ncbi:signal peptide peptidase SppA [Halosquirtibacter laminarini]|uniref:Signal peptide peptidase SppA n=1 Tax=Halosquirtibacter laminarini TaxID=3374600 RepID=A0AC61NIY7_9BACT|nr:signal peptide peptidase SppA [Prolixibacteraceae bacterium]
MKFLRNLLASILGSIIGIGLLFFIGIIIISAIAVATSGDNTVVKDNSVLVIKLNKPFVDRVQDNPFEEFDLPFFNNLSAYGLYNMKSKLEDAAKDPKIKGIYIDSSYGIMAPYATTTEFRDLLKEFKKSGKFIYTYIENTETKTYYLLSVSDSIVANPRGYIYFSGLTTERTYFKNALDKVGVEVQVYKGRGNIYKSATDQYTRSSMSKEDRDQAVKYLGDIWGVIKEQISSSRNISQNDIQVIADDVATFGNNEKALKSGLVDALKYKDQVIEDLKKLSDREEDDKLNLVSISDYKLTDSDEDLKKFSKDKIAIIFAQGAIVDNTMKTSEINPEKIARSIRKVREDENVKAIVLRVNSPGGSAYGSEVMWREIALAKEVKPVIVSMGDYAASGGYYMSCAGTKIIADKNTITGSIGIFATIPNAKKLIQDKIGVTSDYVSTSKNGAPLSIMQPLTSFHKGMLETYINKGYDLFIQRVAEGRGMTKEAVHKIARGRVWSGQEAIKIGLVDKIGDLQDAIQVAKEEAKAEDAKIVTYPKNKDQISALLELSTEQIKVQLIESMIGKDVFKVWNDVKSAKEMNGVYMMLPYKEEIN